MASAGQRRCVDCVLVQKKRCNGGDPCGSCIKKNIPCIEHIKDNKQKRPLDNEMEGHEAERTGGHPSKRRQTAANTSRQSAQKNAAEDEPFTTTIQEMPFVFQGAWWTLRAQLHWSQHPKYSCVVEIWTTFWLIDQDGEHAMIGDMESAVINKSRDDWTRELLDPRGCSRELLSTHDRNNRSRVPEINRVFQMLFNEEGEVQDVDSLQENIYHLNGDMMHYVGIFKIDAALRDTGLGEAVLTLYHAAMTRGPDGFVFDGYSVLSPAAIAEVYEQHEKDVKEVGGILKTYLQVEDALIKFYTKVLYYLLILGNRALDSRALTVMGRPINSEVATLELEILKEAMVAKLPAAEKSTTMISGMSRASFLKLAHSREMTRISTLAQVEGQNLSDKAEPEAISASLQHLIENDFSTGLTDEIDTASLEALLSLLMPTTATPSQQAISRLDTEDIEQLREQLMSGNGDQAGVSSAPTAKPSRKAVPANTAKPVARKSSRTQKKPTVPDRRTKPSAHIIEQPRQSGGAGSRRVRPRARVIVYDEGDQSNSDAESIVSEGAEEEQQNNNAASAADTYADTEAGQHMIRAFSSIAQRRELEAERNRDHVGNVDEEAVEEDHEDDEQSGSQGAAGITQGAVSGGDIAPENDTEDVIDLTAVDDGEDSAEEEA